ncbi:phage portal protein [Candidatus Nesciobacter abundans]|uniref:Phage portal protein n=1 Tax=Candidatus Nesciobacter abundans TaxID=2601668 RepID=A0A5C0UH84_9PROT|nr:phage portal protein [Candidatus Nesciobacter abundans]QEK39041.1 phage portal protein [Candidatus Nesciobacter abundans]
MNLIHRVFPYLQRKDKNTKCDFIPNLMNVNSFSGGSMCKQDFKNIIVYRCISLISRNIANIKCFLYDSENNKVSNNYVSNLLIKPNGYETWFEFVENLVTNLCLHGNAYTYLESGEHGYEMYNLNPENVEILKNKYGHAESYKIKEEKNKYNVYNSSEIMHIKFNNPYCPWVGLSPMGCIKESVRFYDSVTKHNQSILDNGGRPSGAFILKNKVDDYEFEKLKNSIALSHKGKGNAGSIILLQSDVDWKDLSISSKDMDFNVGKNIAAREICQAFGVPPVMLGLQDASFSNYKEARLHFWEDTLLPMANKILQKINDLVWVNLSEKDSSLEKFSIKPDFSSVPALSAKSENA